MHCYFIRWIVVKYLTQIIWHIGNRYFPLGHTTKSSVAVLLGRKYLYNWKQPNLLGGLCGPVSPKCLHLRPISSISSNPPDAYSCFWKICVWKRMKISKKRPELAHFKKSIPYFGFWYFWQIFIPVEMILYRIRGSTIFAEMFS